MRQNLHYGIYCWVILGILTFISCANPVMPTGGPEDTFPPKVVEIESTPNMQTNFTGRSFELTFDEFIKLNDAFNQVVVSPPLEYPPEVSLKKGETVIFEFAKKEVLREEATYIINFGNAVKDLNKGNAAEDLRFVFSTGDFIDSLSVSGSIVDAFSGEPVADILFMLYDNLEDSVVRKERPFYFAKTNKQGTFKIDNIKSDTFKVFALKDNNSNYKFDQVSEMIGYSDEPIIVADSIQNNVKLSVFQEIAPLRLLNKELGSYGHVELIFSEVNPTVTVTAEDVGQNAYWQYQKDTIHLWYDLVDSTNWKIFVQSDTVLYDTLKVKALSKDLFLRINKSTLQPQPMPEFGKQSPFKSWVIQFLYPLSTFDTSAIVLLEDTLLTPVTPVFEIDEKDKKKLVIKYDWKESTPYTLKLFRGALTDWYGMQNDTIIKAMTVLSRRDFGNIKLRIENMKPDTNYVVQLMKGKRVLLENSFKSDSVYVHDYIALPSGGYSIRVIEDVNDNDRWDPGNYTLKKQSERLFLGVLDELQAGWDVEGVISVDR